MPEGLKPFVAPSLSTRRDVFWMAAGWGVFAWAGLTAVGGLVRYLYPVASFDPKQVFRAGFPDLYPKNSVSEAFKKKNHGLDRQRRVRRQTDHLGHLDDLHPPRLHAELARGGPEVQVPVATARASIPERRQLRGARPAPRSSASRSSSGTTDRSWWTRPRSSNRRRASGKTPARICRHEEPVRTFPASVRLPPAGRLRRSAQPARGGQPGRRGLRRGRRDRRPRRHLEGSGRLRLVPRRRPLQGQALQACADPDGHRQVLRERQPGGAAQRELHLRPRERRAVRTS